MEENLVKDSQNATQITTAARVTARGVHIMNMHNHLQGNFSDKCSKVKTCHC
jgi:hypothetical protein